MKHQPRKRFGQNFLQDPQILLQIIDAFQPQYHDNVIEIGPGLGALTRILLPKLAHLTAIEIDTDLHQHLNTELTKTHPLTVICADALTFDYSQFGQNLRLIGNLPYNISTPLLFHLLTHRSAIVDMLFMLQKEVVERMAAQPGSKTYGRLSVMVQYYCEVVHLFNVPASAFYPQPKVESAIVHLKPYHTAVYPVVSHTVLSQLVTQAFSMRRKTLANNLKSLLSATDIQALGIDPSLRPEQISVETYIQLTKFISK